MQHRRPPARPAVLLAAYAWYVVPGKALTSGRDSNVAAYTDLAARRVVFAASQQHVGALVRHEMLHALLGPAYGSGGPARVHPPAYFQGPCAGVVYCGDLGCRDAGPAPVPAPADAPTLPLSALAVRADVTPNPVSRTGADHALSVIVRVRNPTARPVWVSLDATPDLPARWVHWYGFRLVPAGQPVPVTDLARTDSAALVTSGSAHRVAFAAGETRWWTFDLSGAQYPAGDYLAVGIFNTRQAWTPLAVSP